MSNDFKIRTMSVKDMETAVEWAAKEGWNPGLHDAELFYHADENGFFIAQSETGETLGVISAVKYGNDYGFIGFFIVRPDLRGQRIGIELGRLALQYLQGRNIGIDGVLNKVKNYQAFGFKLAYRNMRFKGVAKAGIPAKATGFEKISKEMVIEYDKQFFPAPRQEFIRQWISQPDSYFAGIVNAGKLEGYGLARKCGSGYKIGPLFAENKENASDILNALVNKLPAGSDYYLDIPEVNKEAVELVKERNMEEVFSTARMYNNSAPELPLNKTFGITSFELG